MTEDRLPLNELLQKAGDGDFLRAVAESVLQLLMEADVEGLIGAGRQCRLRVVGHLVGIVHRQRQCGRRSSRDRVTHAQKRVQAQR